MHTYLCLVAAATIVCFVIPATFHFFIKLKSNFVSSVGGTTAVLALGSLSGCFFLYKLDLPTDCSLWLLNPCSLLATGLGVKIFETYELCVRKKDLLNMPRYIATWAYCAMRQHPEDSRAAIAQVIMLPNPATRPFRDTQLIPHIHHHCRCRSAA